MKEPFRRTHFVSAIILIFSIFIFDGCSGPNAPVQHKNNSEKSGASVSSGPTFVKGISEIFARRCASCHAAGSTLPNWSDYETAFAKKDKINQRVVVDRSMPPKEVSTITEEERATIQSWIQAGAPQNSFTQADPPTHLPGTTPASPIAQATPAIPPVNSTPPSSAQESSFGLSFDRDISQIFANRCALCHVARGTLPNWGDYEVTFAKRDRILQRVVVDRSMPPKGNSTITDDERAKIQKWIQSGAPKSTSNPEPVTATSSSSPIPIPTPKPIQVPVATPSFDVDFTRVQKTIVQCMNCHAKDSRQSLPIFARLKGQMPNYLETELKAFRSKLRHDKNAVDYMVGPASQLDDESIHLLALYFSLQKPNVATATTSIETERGKSLFENGSPAHATSSCVGCHGQHAEGSMIAPRLAGQSKVYLLNQFKAFKDGSREEAQMMPNISKNLDAEEELALAIYLESI